MFYITHTLYRFDKEPHLINQEGVLKAAPQFWRTHLMLQMLNLRATQHPLGLVI